jgi:hypothetical protein
MVRCSAEFVGRECAPSDSSGAGAPRCEIASARRFVLGDASVADAGDERCSVSAPRSRA